MDKQTKMGFRDLDILLIGASLLALAACGGDGSLDEIVGSQSAAIIDGTPIKAEDSGFVALFSRSGWCSGTLLTNSWVLSSGHCVTADRLTPTRVTVVMGSQTRRAVHIAGHNSLDVVLLRLDQPFEMRGSKTGWQRKIYAGTAASLVGQVLYCYGYGNSTPATATQPASGFGTLRTAKLRVSHASSHGYWVARNGTEILAGGDSGSSCFAKMPFGEYHIAGVTNVASSVMAHQIGSDTLREWVKSQFVLNNFGSALATGDFNQDGHVDVAIGASGRGPHGRVVVFTGRGYGTFSRWQTLEPGILRAPHGSRFGAALTTISLDKTSEADGLAIGAPEHTTVTYVGGSGNAYQKSGIAYTYGYDAVSDSLVRTRALLNDPICADGDRFGASLASGDFDGDGVSDLVVGAPEKAATSARAGSITVHYLGKTGSAAKAELRQPGLDQQDDRFGFAMASGDFNGDAYDDLAVGTPGDTTSNIRSGIVYVFKGSPGGLFFWKRLEQKRHTKQGYELFGYSLSAGDYDNDQVDDLAVGAPLDLSTSRPRSGAVFVFKGYRQQDLKPWATLTQRGLGGDEVGDWFGAALASGDFDGDHRDDLAITAPGETPGSNPETGYVFVFKGSSTGLTPYSGFGYGNDGDWFGGAIAACKGCRWGADNLVIGAPGRRATPTGPGAAHIYAHGTGGSFSRWQSLFDVSPHGI